MYDTLKIKFCLPCIFRRKGTKALSEPSTPSPSTHASSPPALHHSWSVMYKVKIQLITFLPPNQHKSWEWQFKWKFESLEIVPEYLNFFRTFNTEIVWAKMSKFLIIVIFAVLCHWLWFCSFFGIVSGKGIYIITETVPFPSSIIVGDDF